VRLLLLFATLATSAPAVPVEIVNQTDSPVSGSYTEDAPNYRVYAFTVPARSMIRTDWEGTHGRVSGVDGGPWEVPMTGDGAQVVIAMFTPESGAPYPIVNVNSFGEEKPLLRAGVIWAWLAGFGAGCLLFVWRLSFESFQESV
jgi:hypothetical protein